MKITAKQKKSLLKKEVNLKFAVQKAEEHEVIVTDGKQSINFSFRNGDMTGVRSSLSYKKTREEWEFFAYSILTMLEGSKRFYKLPKKLKKGAATEIPF